MAGCVIRSSRGRRREKVALDFLNQEGNVRPLEADARSGDTVVVDIRKNVFVMRVSTGQFRNVGMFKRIIPGDLFAGLINLVTVVADSFSYRIGTLRCSNYSGSRSKS
jgi:hypothetical protein